MIFYVFLFSIFELHETSVIDHISCIPCVLSPCFKFRPRPNLKKLYLIHFFFLFWPSNVGSYCVFGSMYSELEAAEGKREIRNKGKEINKLIERNVNREYLNNFFRPGPFLVPHISNVLYSKPVTAWVNPFTNTACSTTIIILFHSITISNWQEWP